MKRLICVAFCLIFLCGCGGKQVTPVLKNISFVAEVTYYNEVYSCDCTIDERGELTAVIKIPETLEGFTLKINKDSVTAEFLGISYTPTTGNMPFLGVLDTFYQKLITIAESGLAADGKDNSYKISLGDGADGATLYVTEAGLPIMIEIPDERFYIEFYNLTVNK